MKVGESKGTKHGKHCTPVPAKDFHLFPAFQFLYQLSVNGFENFGILTAGFGCHKAHEFLLQS